MVQPLSAGQVPTIRILQERLTSTGKGLKGQTLRDILEGSYSGQVPNNFQLDSNLSKPTAKVFLHKPSGTAIVAHRGTEGTLQDWSNNASFAQSDRSYKNTTRFQTDKKVQREAEAKYGRENVITVGHSQGGLLAELLGRQSNEVITVNKATKPQQTMYGSAKGRNANQFDVRSSRDVVSAWGKYGESKDNTYTIPARSVNPLTEHSYDILLRKRNRVFGRKDSIIL